MTRAKAPHAWDPRTYRGPMSSSEAITAVLLGIVQGIVEWLPISSQGAVTAVRSFLVDTTLAEAAAFGLWIQLGTTLSVLVVYNRDLRGLLKEIAARPIRISPLLAFLVTATAVGVLIALPLYLVLEDASGVFGGFAMIVIGGFMLITAATQIRQRLAGQRLRNDLSFMDAVLVGAAQGLAVMPGLSRSGLTIAMLLGRRFDRQEALNLSFLLSLPASFGAAMFVGLRSGLISSGEALLAALVAGIVGLFTIRGMLYLATRVNFGIFVLIIAVLLILSGLLDILT
ncbi:MAG: undecaprenyl-diphosphate phosphatase [Dehalococcoidia bacterium]